MIHHAFPGWAANTTALRPVAALRARNAGEGAR